MEKGPGGPDAEETGKDGVRVFGGDAEKATVGVDAFAERTVAAFPASTAAAVVAVVAVVWHEGVCPRAVGVVVVVVVVVDNDAVAAGKGRPDHRPRAA